MRRDSYICAEIAVFVVNLSNIMFLQTAPHTILPHQEQIHADKLGISLWFRFTT